MLSELISQFDQQCQLLATAVRRGDEELVAEADVQLAPLMRRIFMFHAEGRADMELQLDFFAGLAATNCEDEASVRRYTRMMRQVSARYLDGTSIHGPGNHRTEEGLTPGFDASLHELLLDSLPERVAVIGRDYRYIYTNARNASFHKAQPSGFIGRHLKDMIGEERFNGRAQAKLDQCFEGNAISYRYEIADGDGRLMDVNCRMTPLNGADREIIGAVLMLNMHPLYARV